MNSDFYTTPALPFYGDDFFSDRRVIYLGDTEQIIYVALMWQQWKEGDVPDNPELIARLVRRNVATIKKIWKTVIEEFFPVVSDGIRQNRKLEEVRQARKKRISTSAWRRIRINVFERDGYRCVYCGAEDRQLECDHVIPFSRGGRDDESNLATACRPCNGSKSDKTPEEWLGVPS